MKNQTKTNKRAPVKRSGAKARAAALKKILLNVEKKMKGEDVKATLGDYMKLLQLQKEVTQEAPTQITVMWVDPSSDESSDE